MPPNHRGHHNPRTGMRPTHNTPRASRPVSNPPREVAPAAVSGELPSLPDSPKVTAALGALRAHVEARDFPSFADCLFDIGTAAALQRVLSCDCTSDEDREMLLAAWKLFGADFTAFSDIEAHSIDVIRNLFAKVVESPLLSESALLIALTDDRQDVVGNTINNAVGFAGPVVLNGMTDRSAKAAEKTLRDYLSDEANGSFAAMREQKKRDTAALNPATPAPKPEIRRHPERKKQSQKREVTLHCVEAVPRPGAAAALTPYPVTTDGPIDSLERHADALFHARRADAFLGLNERLAELRRFRGSDRGYLFCDGLAIIDAVISGPHANRRYGPCVTLHCEQSGRTIEGGNMVVVVTRGVEADIITHGLAVDVDELEPCTLYLRSEPNGTHLLRPEMLGEKVTVIDAGVLWDGFVPVLKALQSNTDVAMPEVVCCSDFSAAESSSHKQAAETNEEEEEEEEGPGPIEDEDEEARPPPRRIRSVFFCNEDDDDYYDNGRCAPVEMEEEEAERVDDFSAEDLAAFIERKGFDKTQRPAFEHLVRSHFGVVQGPPGTGKSFVGVAAAEFVLKHCDTQGPLLVLCYTNHALDSFVTDIRKAMRRPKKTAAAADAEPPAKAQRVEEEFEELLTPGKLVRLGTRSKLPGMEEFQLSKLSPAGSPQWYSRMKAFEDVVAEWDVARVRPSRVIKSELGAGWSERYPELFNDLARSEEKISEDLREAEQDRDKKKEAVFHAEQNRKTDKKAEAALKTAEAKCYRLERERCRVLETWVGCGKPGKTTPPIRGALPVPPANTHRPHKLAYTERLALYHTFQADWQLFLVHRAAAAAESCNSAVASLRQDRAEAQMGCLRNASVIAATTSGAAMHLMQLQSAGIATIIIEEAAEISEADTIACLMPTADRVMLLGDHQQLRPKLENHSLQHLGVDVSLMERLIRNNAPFRTLGVQRRMHPDIADFTRWMYAERLQEFGGLSDDPCVTQRPLVRGFGRRVFFFDHTEAERSVGQSRANEAEARFAVWLAHHALQNGETSVTLLTPYKGQEELLKKQKHNPLYNNPLSRELLHKARVTTVDNFQGEESDFIIVSLVRSDRPGFLKDDHRVCVLLSRARRGMAVIGQSAVFNTGAWETALQLSQQMAATAVQTPLEQCIHGATPVVAVSAPLNTFNPFGGACRMQCGKAKACGHSCTHDCHGGPCEKYECDVEEDAFCSERHPLGAVLCGQRLPSCTVVVAKLVGCRGNHTVKTECSTPPNPTLCPKKVHEVLPCGHHGVTTCFSRVADRCSKPCGSVRACGHRCTSACAECHPVPGLPAVVIHAGPCPEEGCDFTVTQYCMPLGAKLAVSNISCRRSRIAEAAPAIVEKYDSTLRRAIDVNRPEIGINTACLFCVWSAARLGDPTVASETVTPVVPLLEWTLAFDWASAGNRLEVLSSVVNLLESLPWRSRVFGAPHTDVLFSLKNEPTSF